MSESFYSYHNETKIREQTTTTDKTEQKEHIQTLENKYYLPSRWHLTITKIKGFL